MRTVTGDRIREKLAALGISEAELARRCGLAQSTVNALSNGKSRSSAHLHVIARQLGVSTAWLAGLNGGELSEDSPDMSAKDAAELLGVELIPLVELASYSGGGLSLFPVIRHVPVSADWIHNWIGSRDRGLVFVTKPEGDDMGPTINRGDLVVLDGGDVELNRQDGLFALAYGGVGMIKRVRRLPGGKLELRADNPAIPPIIANDDDVSVLGGIAAVIRRA